MKLREYLNRMLEWSASFPVYKNVTAVDEKTEYLKGYEAAILQIKTFIKSEEMDNDNV